MPSGLRRFVWWSFFASQVLLVVAGTAYVGLGTRDFWLMVGAAAFAAVAYARAVRTTPVPKLDESEPVPRGWYWL